MRLFNVVAGYDPADSLTVPNKREADYREFLQIDGLQVVGVAKGTTRKAGFETLIDGATRREIVLQPDSSALHLIQQVRDEAHRFAITGHRAKRGKARLQSTLEEIPGIGPKRRKQLLEHFGGLQGVRNAGVDALATANGISRELAETIYSALH